MRRTVPVLLIVALSGCGGAGVDALRVDRAWARPTPAGATSGVVYLVVTSPVDDTLVSVAVEPDVAGSATVHRPTTDGGEGGAHSGHDHGGVGDEVAMIEAGRIRLPAGEPVVFEPGGLHVMLDDLAEPLREGDEFAITLRFAAGGSLPVAVEVALGAP